MFEVVLTERARMQYESLDASMTRRVNRAVEEVRTNPFQGRNIAKLAGALRGQYRYRVGRFRIVYSIDEQRRVVTVRGILGRGRAYG